MGKTLGYSVATLTGDAQQVSMAYEQISEKLRRINPGMEGPAILGSFGRQEVRQLTAPPLITLAGQAAPGHARHVAPPLRPQILPVNAPAIPSSGVVFAGTLELSIEQKFVGWLLGKGGKTLREIEAETGATVSVDQSTRD